MRADSALSLTPNLHDLAFTVALELGAASTACVVDNVFKPMGRDI
jgi:hypothetical protein